MDPCIKCGEPPGYPALGNYCTRCARDVRLFELTEALEKATLAWDDYANLIYRHEVYEGKRVPPSDRLGSHDVQGEPEMGLSSDDGVGFSTPMKQGPRRSSTPKRRLTTDDLF